jgi:UDP-3-O-[3-hydroxymyristoyl] glucosamine N-acyltransferase
MRLDEIAEKLLCEIEGDPGIEICGVATLEQASPSDLSFLTNPKYASEAKKTKAAAIIAGFDCPPLNAAILKNENPYLVFAKAIELFYSPAPERPFIHPTAWIADSARIGRGVSVGAYTFIGEEAKIGDFVEIKAHCAIYPDVVIGAYTKIHSGTSIREHVKIGERCVIQNNAVIGSDGFGYAKQNDGTWYKILQAGSVVIGDGVEIGACSTLDRAALGETRVESGAKIDNLVQIGHGSSIGENSLLCAQVGLAGSTIVGNSVILAGQVGVSGHLTIGDRAVATAQAGIGHSIDPDSTVSGSPSMDNKTWLRATVLYSRLPAMHKTLRDLERRIDAIEGSHKETLEASREVTQ